MLDYVLIHYSEIALKGDNRGFFEKKLISNIERSLGELSGEVKRISGRIIIDLNQVENPDIEAYKKSLKKVFGIHDFSFVLSSKQDIEEIERTIWKLAKGKEFVSFAVRTKRANKKFPLNSQEINEKVGEYLMVNFADQDRPKEVELETPDLTFYIEVVEDYAFVYSKKYKGPNGLPVASSGKLVSLLSSGIDSPVASWQMISRGCEVTFAHFHAHPFTKKQAQENVKKIVEKLSPWQGKSKLYLLNLSSVQKEIIREAPEKLRLLFYRRAMIKIANKVAKKENAQGLITGEAVGQVASQTLANLRATGEASNLPIYRPNIAKDKEEIIARAKKLGTYEISTEPYEDCCTYMVPEHPETKANLKEILNYESDFELDELMEEVFDNAETIEID